MREHVKSSELLQEAFETFNEQSLRLQDSYQSLESLVASLSHELQLTQAQRLHELAEKEQLAERLVTLLNALPAGVIVVNHQGVIQELNPAAIALIGDCRIGQLFDQIIPGITIDTILDCSEITLPCGAIVTVSRRALETDNSTILLFSDITERVVLERQVNHQERLSSMGEMMAKLAHQLRTPLSSTLLYASNLANTQLTETRRKEFSQHIHDGLHKLDRMINDMLVFSKNDNAGEDVISIQALLADVENSLRPQLLKVNARWLVESDVDEYFITGNYSLLSGALSNLVMNAIHASGQGALIKWNIQDDREYTYLSLQDNGPGIAEDSVEKIFDPFFTTRKNGTGLGLAVVRTVIQAHKGTIEIDNAIKKGARFLITLPHISKTGLLTSNKMTTHSKQKNTLGNQVCL